MKKLMAANWKMYKNQNEAEDTVNELCKLLQNTDKNDREALIFAPFTCIAKAHAAIKNSVPLSIGAQNFYPAKDGAFTGEISAHMLREIQAAWVLVGHSERRSVFNESLQLVEEKLLFALNEGFKVVFCVGESLEEREAGKLQQVLETQLQSLQHISKDINTEHVAVAYEPVWAIGTGKVAGPDEIVEAHAMVREALIKNMGSKGAETRILYGGSVKPDNAANIIKLDNEDGVLVGGASLQAESFAQIVLA